MNLIKAPLIRANYFHQKLIRIHSFVDGNGRITRLAENWMLMYNLYPPIFLRDDLEKKIYLETLSCSFSRLNKNPGKQKSDLTEFSDQEIDRVQHNASIVFDLVKNLVEERP
jgi:Fic family protein